MKKAKGVNKTVKKHEVKHSNYLGCLKNEKYIHIELRLYAHQNIKSTLCNKVRNHWYPMTINDIL